MNSPSIPRTALAALAAVLLTAASATFSHAQQNSKAEIKCHTTLVKSIGKHMAAVAKAMAACENSVLAGTIPGPCPDTATQAAIDKSAAKLVKTVPKKCQSTCSISGLSCIGGPQCPPNPGSNDNCTAGAKQIVFESASMGFPGAYCPNLLGAAMRDPEDFGVCASGLGELLSDQLLENLYGSIDGSPALSAGAASCLAALVKSAPKALGKMAGNVSKCRAKRLGEGTPVFNADACATADPKVASTLSKELDKFSALVEKACTDSTIAELDICGAGIGGTTSVADAQACLTQMLEEASVSVTLGNTRSYASVSLINAGYPSTASPVCGDNLVNQLPNQFQLLGEECDGDDDSACPGECLPPGDVFQCTCGNVPRVRAFADFQSADLDNGWTGSSHNAKVTDRAGFVAELSNCDCDQFGASPSNAATCVGSSSDPICDSFAELKPRCSHRLDSGNTCDQDGNGNGANTDSDCAACDQDSANPDEYCTGSARFCINGTNQGQRCNTVADCPGFGGSCSGNGVCVSGPKTGNGCVGNQTCGECVGGSNPGAQCATNANCTGGGTCSTGVCATQTCIGGANHDDPCTANAQCPGGRCGVTSDCLSQCYDADDNPTGPCANQTDCAEGERCRGRCSSNTCIIMRNGAPLPLSSEGTSVCIESRFFTNATGTRNIVTGEHEINYDLRSVTYLSSELIARPCPVCGGYCADGSGENGVLSGERCNGGCTGTAKECRFGPNTGNSCTSNAECAGFLCAAIACRFDDDCPMGETCSGTGVPECGPGNCRLDLTCGGGPNSGRSCRIEAQTAFGTTSTDCPPFPQTNQSGAGLAISWTPLTSEAVTLESPAPCDAQGYENYDCNCIQPPPAGGDVRTLPNRCKPACNNSGDPEIFGRECSSFTLCVGGSEAGAFCDEDSDCDGGTCSGNPKVCGDGSTGTCTVKRCAGGTNAGGACFTNFQCPGGTCPASPASCTVGDMTACNSGADGYCKPADCTVDANCDNGATCDDACTGGRCTPLCLERGRCNGGDKDGFFCALDVDCPGVGAFCDADDPEEGACAVGGFYHCNGLGQTFRTCLLADVGTQKGCEAGNNGILGDGDDYLGAGLCIADITNCFFNDGTAEGGDTFNGKGDPTNTRTVATYCIPASTSPAVNTTAGLPGPGRIRQNVTLVPNFTSLP